MAARAPLLTLPPSRNSQNSGNLNKHKSGCEFANYTRAKSSFSPATLSAPLLPASAVSSDYAIAMDSCNCPTIAPQIHAQTIKKGFYNCRQFLETRLLFMYGRCGGFLDACHLFDQMPHRSIYSWVGILTACVENAFPEKALQLFQQLCAEELVLNLLFFVFPVVLKACGGINSIDPGKELHGFLHKRGFISNIYVSNALIDMYGKCGAIDEALKVFDGMEERDCVSWNSMITGFASVGLALESLKFLQKMQSCGYTEPNLVSWSAVIAGFAQNGHDEEALGLLRRMLDNGFKPNAQTLVSILPCSSRLEDLGVCKEIHGYVIRHNLTSNQFIVNGLIDVYCKCGVLESALDLFRRSSVRNLVSYNAMISGYCRNGNLSKANEFFNQMKLDGLNGDAISWNSMISGYCDEENFEEALKFFREMREEGVEADSSTICGALTACAALGAINKGKEIHTHAISTGLNSIPFVCNALIEMYFRCHDFMSAELVFHSMVDESDRVTWNIMMSCYARANRLSRARDLLGAMRNHGFEPNMFTWNGLIAGCMENEHYELVLDMVNELQSSGLKPDIYTTGMIISLCSRLLSLGQGKQAHSYAIRHGFDTDVHIGAMLVDMYAKCGAIQPAFVSFGRISWHNLVSFNSLLSGYALNGFRTEGLQLFQQMLEDEVIPDSITFLSVLSLCVHAGSVEDGLRYFRLMEDYAVRPTLKHYTCMVDLFSRAGKLDEAFVFVQNLPVEPDGVVWGALLAGCAVHRDVRLGETAADRLIEVEGDDAGAYVLAAKLYGGAGRMEDSARMRRNIGDMRMWKRPGWSWIEEKGRVHVFRANDSSHARAREIYAAVGNLNSQLKMEDLQMAGAGADSLLDI